MITPNILIILATSIVIYYTGCWFATSSSKIGDYLHLPRSVKGATFDAISSSLPELMIALFSVIIFKRFDVGIGTIAGSALFNLLVIPGISVLVAPKVFKVSKEIISRDAIFYLVAVFALLSAIIYSQTWGIIIPLIFLFIYALYLKRILKHTRRFKKGLTIKQKQEQRKAPISKHLVIFFSCIIAIAAASYFLTYSAIDFSEEIGVPAVIIAFTIVAAATSIPDTVISVANAKKGDIDDATSNVFGSNIFDILIGLSIPLLIAYFIMGPTNILFTNIEIILGLLGATILTIYFIAEDRKLTKFHAIVLLALYLAFIAYVIYLAVI